jgi:hypothetical protein
MGSRVARLLLAGPLALVCALVLIASAGPASAAVSRGPIAHAAVHAVLLVGSFDGKPGAYATVQEAVDAARPGDWILIGPGDYKETGARHAAGALGDDQAAASVLVTTPGLHIRGMSRNTVVIDGTKPGSPQCSSAEADQTFGPAEGESWQGNNGVLVYKANGVSVENLTACNFLGANHGGDAIWFDGGGASGKQEIGKWNGAWLTATSTFWAGKSKPAGMYGIYASNTFGPGVFAQTYASNMADSGYYIGACPDCWATINHGRSEGNDLGYSGSNSGGELVIENSEFKNNEEGVATQSQNNDDAPSPQDGKCAEGAMNPRPPAGAQRHDICWVMIHNKVIDNNNGNTPTSPGAPGLLGTGMTIAGGRDDLVVENTFAGNKAWGILLVPYPATETPPPQIPAADNCRGGIGTGSGETSVCYFDDFANEIEGNKFAENGGYGNPTNGDIGEVSNPEANGNCWHGNTGPKGSTPSSTPAEIQSTHGTCGQPNTGEPASSILGAEATCDSQLVATCPEAPGEKYPRGEVKLLALPKLPSMPNPCAGVPANAWCESTAAAATTAAVSRRRG